MQGNAGEKEDFYFNALLAGLAIIVALLLVFSFFNAQKNYYSALYFAPREIPGTAVAGQPFAFSFFVENHEGKAVSYVYSISAEGKTGAEKTAELNDGEARLFNETFTISKPSAEKQKVSVEMKKPGSTEPYKIFFWVSVSQ